MKKPGKLSSASGRDRLSKLLATSFRDFHRACEMFDEFLGHTTYNQTFCLTLLAVAKQRTRMPWDLRRLAVLMLEHQILKLGADDFANFAFILTQLDLLRTTGSETRVVSSVLKEGYSTTDFRGFIPEFRSRLARLNRVHSRIQGKSTTNQALRDFIQLSSRNCKLTLARYLFKPEDIVDEILRQVEVTEGVKDLSASSQIAAKDMTRTLSLFPSFEAQILRLLCENSNIYWVSEKTPSEINSLVEYPATTVVLVVKAPGSDIEFEIKRAGRKGCNSLKVVYGRNGYTVPPSHRLDGGSMQWLLQYEANHASKLSFIYRVVHGEEAPMATYPARTTVYSVPTERGEVQILPYFTDPALFGKDFGQMRAAMKRCVVAFNSEGNANLPSIPGDLGLTAQFIGQVMPAQAILCGTSSFRLNKLAAYLSSDGDKNYFKTDLGINYEKEDAIRLADELLEEILGVYQPPRVKYQTYEQYLRAAFAVAANRERADQNYLALAKQIAKFWGTLLAVGGFTRGESFVGRNVGLKSYWDKGAWKVKMIFMDHDAMVVSGPGDGQFYAKGALPNMSIDERYIWGRSNPKRFATSELGYLEGLYRIGSDIAAQGQTLAHAALKEAYKKTQQQLLTNEKLKPLFSKVFIDRLLVWDTLVEGYLQMNGDKSANAKWKKQMRSMLTTKGYKRDAFSSYTETIEKHRDFLERYSFLFEAPSGNERLTPPATETGPQK